MNDNEERLLVALVNMVEQYLTRTDDENGLDNLCMTAGETAMELLAERGLVELSGGGRLGRWTPQGNAFRDSH